MLMVWIVGKSTDGIRRSYRGDLVEQDSILSGKKNSPSKPGTDAAKNISTSDTTINEISGDSYLADLIKKQLQR